MEYTEVEVATWKTIYRNLKKLFKTNACTEFNRILPLLEENCGYSEDNIPQLQDVSTFLQSETDKAYLPLFLKRAQQMILCMAPLLQTRLVSGFVLWLVCYPPGTSWPAWLSGFSTRLSTSATRPGPSTHRSLTSVTSSSDTSRFLPTQHSQSSHRKSDWLRLAPATNTSRNWPL